jgi:hypothetical protein
VATDADAVALLQAVGQPGQAPRVRGVAEDRYVVALRQLRVRCAVVEVVVGGEDLLQVSSQTRR